MFLQLPIGDKKIIILDQNELPWKCHCFLTTEQISYQKQENCFVALEIIKMKL